MIAVKAYPRFQRMLDQYDSMNASVQEDLIGIRVVKAFVRGDHESEKNSVRRQPNCNRRRKKRKNF